MKKITYFFTYQISVCFKQVPFFWDLSGDERGGTDDARVNFLTEINSQSKIKSSIDKNHDLSKDNDGSHFKLVEFMISV